MATDRLANRWGIAVAAVIMQLCLGAVYGWSVFVKPLTNSTALDTHAGFTQLHPRHCLPRGGNRHRRTLAGSRRPTPGRHRCRHSLRPRLHGGGLSGGQSLPRRDVPWLRCDLPARHGHGLYLSGRHSGEVVPRPARPDDRSRGLRLRRGRTGDEPARRPGNPCRGRAGYFPDSGNCVPDSGSAHGPVLPESSAGLASSKVGSRALPFPRPPPLTTSR